MAVNQRFEPPRPTSAGVLEAVRARLTETARFHPREVVVLAVLGVLVVTGATLAYLRTRPVAAGAMAPIETAAVGVGPSPASGASIIVHVAGAVRRPGVYEFAEGARVVDAIDAAGGLTPKADAAAINMARLLTDGEQVLVPRRGPPSSSGTAPGTTAGGEGGALVNINTATVGELETLPGIGPVLAQRIIDYRDQHGPFRTTADLQKVSGIGPKTYESIAPHVTV